MFQRRRWLSEVILFFIIIALGFASRFWLVDFPNVKPVAALVLFGAFFFRRSSVAIVAMIAVMVMSDLKLGVYQWPIVVSVYLSLGIAGLLGIWIKRSCAESKESSLPPIGLHQTWRFGVASIAMSTAFFVLTNAVWFASFYPATLEGLLSCYTAAVPFYRATLMGDFVLYRFAGWELPSLLFLAECKFKSGKPRSSSRVGCGIEFLFTRLQNLHASYF